MNKEPSYEVNFDGIVGQTHNYSGLSFGNIASMQNEQNVSNPRLAALQGLEKMKFLMGLGLKQGVLPPHERPHIPSLKLLGFHGSDADIVTNVYQKNPKILFECSSASGMWAANAATISPSPDSIDNHVHITTANLTSKFHRSLERKFTAKVLKAIFKDPLYFTHHNPLPSNADFADEGAANHSRFCGRYDFAGIQLFVFGRNAYKSNTLSPELYPARQTYEASQTIIRLHQLFPERAIIAQQNPRAIDAGMFHNDVASVGNRNVFLYHDSAFIGTENIIDQLKAKVSDYCDTELICIPLSERQISFDDAVNSYLFNSQLVSLKDDSMALIAPMECKNIEKVQDVINGIITSYDNPIKEVHYIDLLESMHNGGGPACLRLRVALKDNELAAIHQEVLLTDRLYTKLNDWIVKHYRDHLLPKDLADPHLVLEVRTALDELTKILNLGSIYSFQK